MTGDKPTNWNQNQKSCAVVVYLEFIAYLLMKGQDESNSFFNQEKHVILIEMHYFSCYVHALFSITEPRNYYETNLHATACMNCEPLWVTGWLHTIMKFYFRQNQVKKIWICRYVLLLEDKWLYNLNHLYSKSTHPFAIAYKLRWSCQPALIAHLQTTYY